MRSLSPAKLRKVGTRKKPFMTRRNRVDTRSTMSYLVLVPSQFRWQAGAACKGVPSYLFFPEEMEREGFEENPLFIGKKAEDYCAQCPVRNICREFSVLHDMEGIWGNTDDKFRRRRYERGERFEMRDIREEMGTYSPLYGHS